MGHTKAEDLRDLEPELEKIRKLAGMKEKSPGIFYYKSASFLHFHDKDGVRWADLKVGEAWKSLPVDFKVNKKQRAGFVAAVRKEHAVIAKPSKS